VTPITQRLLHLGQHDRQVGRVRASQRADMAGVQARTGITAGVDIVQQREAFSRGGQIHVGSHIRSADNSGTGPCMAS